MKKIFLFIGLAITCFSLQAQQANPKIQFNGVARGDMLHNWLSSDDTTNVDQKLGGAALIDMHLNIHPNESVRINTTLRVKNAIGGFWGQGASLELREISIKGVAGKVVKYRFGDIDSKLTEYTLFNNNGECTNNEADVFSFIREIRHQENFNNDNYWRNQGADLAWKLGFDKGLESADFLAFIMRNRSLNDGITPDRLQGGGKIQFNINDNSYFGVNYINMFDLPKTISKNTYEKYSNGVATIDAHLDFDALYFFGEGGISSIDYTDTSDTKTVETNGYFFDFGLGKTFVDKKLKTELSYRYVNPNFFSAGAQSKRIDYTSSVNVLSTVGENSYERAIGLLDMVVDDDIYNQAIYFGLMDYNMIYNNVTPYGKATPNRQGFDLMVSYGNEKFDTKLDCQLLQDVAGQGSDKKKNYILAQWSGNLYVDKIFQWDRTINLTAGYQYASANRDEDRVYKSNKQLIEAVDLASHTIDLGTSIELINRLDLLLGTKLLFYKGSDFKATLNDFNETVKYTCETYDGSQMLHAGGLRYRFNDNISLTLQYNRFIYTDNLDEGNSYTINQAFMLFNVLF